MNLNFLYPNWSAPTNVFALTTTRHGGCSDVPFDSNNLALHVEDNAHHVLINRNRLKEHLHLPNEPAWLNQTHSTECVVVEEDDNRQADAAITRSPSQVLAIMTADCLPIILCNQQGDEVAAIHAGWRGLLNGVIQQTVSQMHSHPQNIMAWIGPANCKHCYEVGDEVRKQFVENYSFADNYFSVKQDKWLVDIAGIAEHVLRALGISAVHQSNVCTFEEKNDFFSYRRAAKTGRIATLIWFKD